ncbi:voltage-gated potassium channel [Agromyces rhizosphaerae]|uniref:Voltage-gated potassium channel n=1 Tax=Agromyces rhizosphaerae TaxID=88374 RepID=A0A9W6CTG6_9MICO|nr:potassium channel family protein [Agromyces rhizosphaerae]GLI26022.1 voltage-gated potassium channel [Agromyces rhizosphaerae]
MNWPLLVLGASFIVSYSFLILDEGQLPPAWRNGMLAAAAVTWLAFFVDYVVRLAVTPRRWRWYFVTHSVIDLLSVLIPLFRAFRVMHLLREVPYLRLKTGNAVRTRIIAYMVGYAALFVYFIALATLHVEQDAPGATITDFGLALWWAVVTIATVGYGDTYPVTVVGRLYATGLMIGGIAIVGAASATMISLISEKIGISLHRDIREDERDDG